MAAVIVGHGLSLLGQKQGNYIDSFESIVRFCHVSNPTKKKWADIPRSEEDFGKKTNYIATQFNYMDTIWPVDEIWIIRNFGDSTWSSYVPLEYMMGIGKLQGYNIVVFNDIVYWWYQKFLGLFPSSFRWSKGMLAVIVTAYHLRPNEICLAGFDSIKSKDPNYHHDAKSEHELIEMIADKYKINIWYL